MSSDDQTQKLSPDTIVILSRLDAIEARLSALEQKVDERLHDTRPIWEAVQAKLTEVDSNMRRMQRQFEVVAEDLLKMRADVRDVNYRMDKMEQKPS